MIVELKDSVAGAPIYVNPQYVVTLRPDPAEPARLTLIRLSDGESVRVVGDHEEIAAKLAPLKAA